MGCGCSAKTVNKENDVLSKVYKDSSKFNEEDGVKQTVFSSVMFYTLKILAFLMMMVLVPFIMLAVIWFIFNIVVLNKDIDAKRITMVLSSKLKRFNEDDFDGYEDDDEFEEDDYDEDNYELIDVEEIK